MPSARLGEIRAIRAQPDYLDLPELIEAFALGFRLGAEDVLASIPDFVHGRIGVDGLLLRLLYDEKPGSDSSSADHRRSAQR